MTETPKLFPEQLYDAGFTDLVSVIPPGAALSPSSKIDPSQAGKCPGRRNQSGLWGGYDWRKHETSAEDVRRWTLEGANVGLRASRFPAVDIDCTDADVAGIIEQAALDILGPAPVRIGRAPKRLLMYRTDAPFGRMRLVIKDGEKSHLVEILGEGQQYLVHGLHPATLLPYQWLQNPTAFALTTITREQADAFLTRLVTDLRVVELECERVGDGRVSSAAAPHDQLSLRAPSLEALADAVSHIPNTDTFFPTRDDYIGMGYAIKASVSEDDAEEGFGIFASWAGSRESDGRVAGNPETWRADWRKMSPPFKKGWPWIAQFARDFGFNDAALEFDADLEARRDEGTVPAAGEESAPLHSEQWLAEQVVGRRRSELRYVPATGKFLVWDGARWQVDGDLMANDLVKRELKALAIEALRRGATEAEAKKALELAQWMCTAQRAGNVRGLIQSDRAIAVPVDALDADPWLLNTPAGVVDLTTGALRGVEPDALCTKATRVQPEFGGACPEWKRFLAEATAGDRELEAYLQRLCGYALTGVTNEHHLTFIWGPGGNGKSVFLNVLQAVLGDYARVAPMDTFTASQNDRHSTELAMLMGARLVTASETQAGKRWDEAKVKALTGGESITARFMRQDNFTFLPQFKLVFVGNHKPEIRDVDPAMRRRIHLVPFTVTPKRVDRELGAKLRDEYPAILAWMIEGCLAWQRQGLAAPQIVRDTSAEYFRDEDALGRFLEECTESDEAGAVASSDLFNAWREWANAQGEWVGTQKRFSSALVARGFARWQHPTSRRAGFRGLTLLTPSLDFGVSQ